MYKSILNKLFIGNSDQACKYIFSVYKKKGRCVVDYLYFANITSKHLFDNHFISVDVSLFREALLADYKNGNISTIYKLYQDAILSADVVLPDGIALQLFTFFDRKQWLHNLNGTDFCPYFLSYTQAHFGQKNINIILYGTYSHLLEKTRLFLLKQGYNVVYAQDGYTNLDRNKVDLALKGKTRDINILLVARSTPDYPIQEIWTLANQDMICHYGLIVMNQGGTFDFWVGAQKRAPKIIRKMKLEWLRRLITNPKRNCKKVINSLKLFRYIFVYLLLKNT